MSNYPRSYGTAGSDYPPDKIWGTVFIVLYAFMLGITLLVVLGIGGALVLGAASPKSGVPGGGFIPAAFLGFVEIFLVVAIGIHIVAAVGMRNSRAWGFWATIALSILSLLGSSGGMCLTVIPMVYSILRLCGVVGPKPS